MLHRLSSLIGVTTLTGLCIGGGIYYVNLGPATPLATPVPYVVPLIPHTAIRDVPWFSQHVTERKAKLTACAQNPGLAIDDPECINADAARQHANNAAVLRMLNREAAR